VGAAMLVRDPLFPVAGLAGDEELHGLR